MSAIFPDVCKTPTPGGPVPIPYPNIGKAADSSSGPSDITTDGNMPMTKDAKYMISAGDEAGSAGGVVRAPVSLKACAPVGYGFVE